MGEQQFKVGDRVCSLRGCEGFYPAGATGTVVVSESSGCWIRFDAGHGVNPRRGMEWYASHNTLTLSRRPRLIDRLLAKFPRLRALSTNEGGR